MAVFWYQKFYKNTQDLKSYKTARKERRSMKHFRSEYAFKKHKPHESWRKRVLRFFRKKQYIVPTNQDTFHYKTNPFKVHKKPRKIKIRLIIFAVFLLAWTICLAYIPYFRITKINYFGLTNTAKSELDEFIYGKFLNKKSILPLNNYFFINKDKISGNLYERFSFENVEVIKTFPNQLDVNIKEKISSVIYDNGKKYFLLDSGGTVIKYLKDVEPYELLQTTSSASVDIFVQNTTSTTSSPIMSNLDIKHVPDYKKVYQSFGAYPIVYDKRGLEVEVKQENILPAEHIAAVIAWYKTLTEQGIANPKFFTLDNLNSGIAVDTDKSWVILFQPKNNTDTQISTLKEILHTIKPQEKIDLRFGEKVYWK